MRAFKYTQHPYLGYYSIAHVHVFRLFAHDLKYCILLQMMKVLLLSNKSAHHIKISFG